MTAGPDAAAALVVDGVVVAAVQEHRFGRTGMDTWPSRSVCRFAALTGVPVLLARDLPADACGAHARAQIDVVAVGDGLVERDPRRAVADHTATMPEDVWPAALPA